jgi:hypothetical protein
MEKRKFGCVYCGQQTNTETVEVISSARGGCKHLANLVEVCVECKKHQGKDTPLEWWARQQWEKDNANKKDVSAFDYGGWDLADRQELLLKAAYWEARARWHMREYHNGVKANFT